MLAACEGEDGGKEIETKNIPPPPYSPERPPPPYALQNTLTETKESRGRVAPTPFTPFSAGTPTATVYPRSSSPQPIIVATSGGVNPSADVTPATVIQAYEVKKAPTAEPYEEFCPKCQCRSRTKQKYVTGKLTWLLVIIILIVFFPLAFLPFLIRSCKDVHHYCPKCSTLLSIKKRFFF